MTNQLKQEMRTYRQVRNEATNAQHRTQTAVTVVKAMKHQVQRRRGAIGTVGAAVQRTSEIEQRHEICRCKTRRSTVGPIGREAGPDKRESSEISGPPEVSTSTAVAAEHLQKRQKRNDIGNG